MSLLIAVLAGVAAVAVEPEGSPDLPSGAVRRLAVGESPIGTEAASRPGPLRNVAVSADGTEIVIGGANGVLSVWEARTGRLQRRLTVENAADGGAVSRRATAPIHTIGVTADGTIFAQAGNTLVRWNANGGRYVVPLDQLGGGPHLGTFSPDGRVFVHFGERPPIGLWDTSTGRRRHALDDSVWADLFEFSPDSRRLVVARMFRLYLFDVETGDQIWKQRLEGTIRHLRFAADGSRMTALVDYEGLLDIDVARGDRRPQPSARHSRGGGSDRKIVAVSPDGTLVAESDAAPRLHVWELATGRDVLVLSPGDQPATAAVFLPDGRRLVSVTAAGTGLVWDLTSADFADTPPGDAPLTSEEGAGLWRQLGDDSGKAAWRALVALVHRPDEALRLVESPPSLDGLARRLIGQLDHADSSLRARSTRRLAEMSVAAEALLREALETDPSVEAAARLRRLLRRLAGPDKQDEIARLARERRFRDLRTIRLLEWIGTSEARRLLESRLTEWNDPQVQAEAARALERWPEGD